MRDERSESPKRNKRSLFRRVRSARAEPESWTGGPPEVLERPAPGGLVVEQLDRDSKHTLVLAGALDLDSAQRLEEATRGLLSKGTTAITLDLSKLIFIDSSGLWAITTVRKWCTRSAVEFSLIPGPEPVHSVFEMTGLSDLLPFKTGGAADLGSTPREPSD